MPFGRIRRLSTLSTLQKSLEACASEGSLEESFRLVKAASLEPHSKQFIQQTVGPILLKTAFEFTAKATTQAQSAITAPFLIDHNVCYESLRNALQSYSSFQHEITDGMVESIASFLTCNGDFRGAIAFIGQIEETERKSACLKYLVSAVCADEVPPRWQSAADRLDFLVESVIDCGGIKKPTQEIIFRFALDSQDASILKAIWKRSYFADCIQEHFDLLCDAALRSYDQAWLLDILSAVSDRVPRDFWHKIFTVLLQPDGEISQLEAFLRKLKASLSDIGQREPVREALVLIISENQMQDSFVDFITDEFCS